MLAYGCDAVPTVSDSLVTTQPVGYFICSPLSPGHTHTPGTGTFGRVVLAKDIPTRHFFALKIMTIAEVIRLKQVEHVNSEKTILAAISHPFIVDM